MPLATLIIFAAAYTAIAAGRLPGFPVSRASAAIIGAVAMIAAGALSLRDAFFSIDYNTIALLFGMMVVIAFLRLSGVFRLAGAKALKHTHRPVILLIAVVCASGFLSAFLVNDAVCLAFTPLVLDVASDLRRNPVPYLLGLAMAANAGSCCTITGNPQNMIIGSASGIRYTSFAAALSPVGAISLVLVVVVVVCFYRQEFRFSERFTFLPSPAEPVKPAKIDWVMLWKPIAATAGMVLFFFLGVPAPVVALVAAAFLLATQRAKPEDVFGEVDWSLLALFCGLFVIVAGVEKTPLFSALPALAARLRFQNAAILSAASGALSNLVSNVPAVLLLKPLIPHLPHAARSWLLLAMSSTLAGNLTIVGSVANLIVIHGARRTVEISFWDYFKVGAPLTVVTIVTGVFWLAR